MPDLSASSRALRLRLCFWLCLLAPDLAHALEPSPGPVGKIVQARPGPWGNLEYTRIIIEPPDEFMAADYPPPYETVWNFAGHNPGMLLEAWRSAGLGNDQIEALQRPEVLTVSADGITVRPGAELVASLAPAARSRLYDILAGLPGNPDQQMPFHLHAFRRKE